MVVLLLTVSVGLAQRGPLTGSGKTVTRLFDYKDFDKLSLKDLQGEIEVEIGKPFSISVTIDDNLEPLLQVKSEGGVLTVELKGNKNNTMYIEDTHIKVRISLPEISVLEHRGNTDAAVMGIVGRYFRLQNDGNGDVLIKGSIDELDISNIGNGQVNAGNLQAKTAKITKRGNGDVTVNVSSQLKVVASGNGDIINRGNADFHVSGKSGNGDLIKKN